MGNEASSSETSKFRNASRTSSSVAVFFKRNGNTFQVAIHHRHAIAVRADAQARADKTRAIPFAQQFLRLLFHFFFFAADEGNDVSDDVHRGNTRIASSGNGLQRDDKELLHPKSVRKRLEHDNQAGSGTIRICDDKSGIVAAIFLLHREWIGRARHLLQE